MKKRRIAFSRLVHRLNFVFVFITAILLAVTFWYSSMMVGKIQKEEQIKIRNWATSLQRQTELMEYTRTMFANLELDERKYATVWAYAYERLLSTNTSPKEFDFFIRVISDNHSIPFMVIDQNGRIVESYGEKFDVTDSLLFSTTTYNQYTHYDPLTIEAENEHYLFYYKPSSTFIRLHDLLDDLSQSFSVTSAAEYISVPIVITDTSRTRIIQYANVDPEHFYSLESTKKLLKRMEEDNPPIVFNSLNDADKSFYVFYNASPLLKGLRYLPVVLSFALLALLIGIAFLLNLSRRNEQNLVWCGMSKETAHQLGTPISSLLAWIEFYKLMPDEPITPENLAEIEKDVLRLQMIAQRFSKIGSIPELKARNVVPVVYRAVAYIQSRSSKLIHYHITPSKDEVVYAYLHSDLFEWVIENLCKNAVNAIGGDEGDIYVDISDDGQQIFIDVKDTGKGIPHNMFSSVFEPGFTTKARGWGLGLTLSKRIVKSYHKGRIFVKSSVINGGTTFRIVLNAAPMATESEDSDGGSAGLGGAAAGSGSGSASAGSAATKNVEA